MTKKEEERERIKEALEGFKGEIKLLSDGPNRWGNGQTRFHFSDPSAFGKVSTIRLIAKWGWTSRRRWKEKKRKKNFKEEKE